MKINEIFDMTVDMKQRFMYNKTDESYERGRSMGQVCWVPGGQERRGTRWDGVIVKANYWRGGPPESPEWLGQDNHSSLGIA